MNKQALMKASYILLSSQRYHFLGIIHEAPPQTKAPVAKGNIVVDNIPAAIQARRSWRVTRTVSTAILE